MAPLFLSFFMVLASANAHETPPNSVIQSKLDPYLFQKCVQQSSLQPKEGSLVSSERRGKHRDLVSHLQNSPESFSDEPTVAPSMEPDLNVYMTVNTPYGEFNGANSTQCLANDGSTCDIYSAFAACNAQDAYAFTVSCYIDIHSDVGFVFVDQGVLSIDPLRSLYLSGGGNSVLSNWYSSSFLYSYWATNIHISDLRFVGFEYKVQSIIEIIDAKDILFTGVSMDGGFYSPTAISIDRAYSVSFIDCSFNSFLLEDAYVHVVYLSSVDFLTFTNTKFADNFVTNVVSGPGAALYASGGYLDMSNCTFSSNIFKRSGAIEMVNVGGIIRDSSFSDNLGFFSGAIHCIESCPNIIGSEFSRNLGISDGGAIFYEFAADVVDSIIFSKTKFVQNEALSSGGAVAISLALDVFSFAQLSVFMEECTFHNNLGSDGGAVFLSESISSVYVSNCDFTDNRGLNGAAIYFTENIGYGEFIDSVFMNNSASKDGGAIFIGKEVYFMYFDNCDLIRNECNGMGGGIYIGDGTTAAIADSSFVENGALIGGALYLGVNTAFVQLYSSVISENFAYRDGGGIAAEQPVDFSLLDTILSGNWAAQQGGAVYIGIFSEGTTMQACTFLFNDAGSSGGAISISSRGVGFSIFSSQFEHNTASDIGGGIYIGNQVQDVSMFDLSMTNCEAEKGGAIGVSTQNAKITMENMKIASNRAWSHGGALYIGGNNADILLNDVSMTSNLAFLLGGAVFIDNRNNRIRMKTTALVSNRALFGGGLFISTVNDGITIEESVFDSNFALLDGGGVNIDMYNTNISIHCRFQNNTAAYNGGGVSVGILNRGIVFDDCTFAVNRAADTGGACYIDRGNTLIEFTGGSILSNTAGNGGGALFVDVFNTAVSVSQMLVQNNTAALGYGGGIYSKSAFAMRSSQCIQNEAALGGGGAYLEDAGHVIEDSVFHANDCPAGNGGGILLFRPVLVTVSRTEFDYNTAVQNGGAIAIFEHSSAGSGVAVVQCDFLGNSASLAGGAIYASSSSSHSISESSFVANTAGYDSGVSRRLQTGANIGVGGGVCFVSVASSRISESRFDDQAAGLNGGAIELSSCHEIELLDNTIEQSLAATGSGSAVHVIDSDEVKIRGNNITRNEAPFGGGAVYWKYSESDAATAVENPADLWRDNWFEANAASYGDDSATSIVALVAPDSIYVTSYGTVVDAFTVQLLDFYGNVYNIDSSTLVSVEITQDFACSGRSPNVGGTTLVTVTGGLGTFSGLRPSCFPGGSMTVLFTASIDGGASSSGTIDIVTSAVVRFRECRVGEVIVDGACEVCPEGFYSFDQSAQSSCKKCPAGSEVCEGWVIDVKPGFWRSDLFSSQVIECPYGDYACLGGTQAGNATCEVGYEGPLCAVCSDGYYFSSADGECLACSASGLNIAGIVIVSVLGFFLLIPLCYLGLQWAFSSTAETLVTDFSVDTIAFSAFVVAYTAFIPGADEKREELEATFNELYARWWAQAKVILSLVQIMSALPVVTNVEFPPIFAGISGVMSQFNVDLPSSFGILCQADYDYVDVLAVTTLTPLAFWAVLWLVYGIHYMYARVIEKQSTASMIATYGTYLWIYLFTSYMVLPGVAVNIFSMFSCHDISSDESYLRVDYSISCYSARYDYGTLWAGVMAIVYCFGMPFTYFILLYKRRETIIGRSEPESCTKLELLKITPLTFLFAAYEPQFWYWEVIETGRRLTLTGVLVLVAQGSATQLVIGMLVAVFFIKLYAYYKPYEDDYVDTDAEVAQYQVFFAMFILLMIQNDLIHNGRTILDAMLVLNFLVLFLFPIYRLLKTRAWYQKYMALIAEQADDADGGDVDKGSAVEMTKCGNQGDSDDESLGSADYGYSDIYKSAPPVAQSGSMPPLRQKKSSLGLLFKPMPPQTDITSFEAQFEKAGDKLIWTPCLSVSIVPQRESDGSFNYVMTASFTGGGDNLTFEKSLKQFESLKEELHPFVVVVAFPRGMKHPYPDDGLTGWMFADNAERSLKRSDDLAAWFNELTHSEKLMSVRDAHALITQFVGASPTNHQEVDYQETALIKERRTAEALL